MEAAWDRKGHMDPELNLIAYGILCTALFCGFEESPDGPSSASRPSLRGKGRGLHAVGTVVMPPQRPANRWNDGPTLSIREGESERTAMLRILQAPLPPSLHAVRPVETPTQRRSRYLRDSFCGTSCMGP